LIEPEQSAVLGGPPRCRHCGEPMGVYEPVVHVVQGRPIKTSRAAEPTLSTDPSAVIYHFLCYGLISQPRVAQLKPT
jgi:hypothetical protein